jgi:hypothetical protein
MSAKFFPKEAKFEKKSQVAPNAIVFHRQLSDAGKLLLLALNGIATCTYTWTVIQSDIQKRMGWGRDKMRGAVHECIKHGYMKIKQNRLVHSQDPENKWQKKGQFAHNEFEFDMEPSYLNENQQDAEKCPHNECQPTPDFPSPDVPSTENQSSENKALPSTRDLPCIGEQTNSDEAEPVVVIPSYEEDEEDQKRDILEDIGLPENLMPSCLCLSLSHIKDAVAAFEQYKDKKAVKGEIVENPIGMLRRALMSGWKPNITKEDLQNIKNQKAKRELDAFQKNKQFAVKLAQENRAFFTNSFCLDTEKHENCVILKYASSFMPLPYNEEGFMEILEYYIENNKRDKP